MNHRTSTSSASAARGAYREPSETEQLRAELARAQSRLAKIDKARSRGVLYRVDGVAADWTYSAHTARRIVAPLTVACVAGHYGTTLPPRLTATCCAVSVYVFVRALPRAEDER